MKKIISLALVLLVVLSLAACGNFDQKVYFLGTWTGKESKDGRVPASTMTINEDNTGVLKYGDITYNFKWVNHPSQPEILLVKEMVDDSGEKYVPTEGSTKMRCPKCYLENSILKVKDNKCPKCDTEYPEEFNVSCVINCTYTVYQGQVRMMVNDGDGLDKIDKMTLVLDKQP